MQKLVVAGLIIDESSQGNLSIISINKPHAIYSPGEKAVRTIKNNCRLGLFLFSITLVLDLSGEPVTGIQSFY